MTALLLATAAVVALLVELASDRHRVGPLPVAACLLIVCALTVGLVNQAGL